jgi:hypothetical protein
MTVSVSMPDSEQEKPWYKHLWPWLAMLPPAAAVIGGLTTAWLAGGPPALVVDDYADIARVTVERAVRDRRASELGLRADLSLLALSGTRSQVRLALAATMPGYAPPGALQLELIHPTREERDQRVDLRRSGGVYVGELDAPAGRIYLQLSDPDGGWRLVGELPAGASGQSLAARPVTEND